MPRTNSKVTKSVLPLCQYPQIEYTYVPRKFTLILYLLYFYIYIFILLYLGSFMYIVYLLGSSCRRV